MVNILIMDCDIPNRTLTIDCDACSEQGTDTCDNCVITFLCGRLSDRAVVVDLDEYRGLRLLGDAGLVPPLRHTGSAPMS